MKKSVRNSRRGPVQSWWVVLCLVVLLTAFTVKESDGQAGGKDAVGPNPTERSDWQVPGLVDRSGTPVEVPTPGPATGRTLDATDFGQIWN